MKKTRKLLVIVSLLLAVAFVASACQKKTEAPATTESQAANATAKPTEEMATEEEKEPLELYAMCIQYEQVPDEEGTFWAVMEEKFNVDYHIDWVPDGGYADKLNMVLTSGSLPDLVQVVSLTEPTPLKACQSGVFADLTDVLGDFSQWPNLGEINPDAWQNSKIDGRNYLFPRSRGHYNCPAIFIRADWVEALGMEMPSTMDEYADYLKAVVKEDLDGNGEIDTIGATELIDWQYPSAFGPGMRIPVYSDNGGIIHYYLTESYAKFLEYWQDLYAEGCVAKEYALTTGTQREEMFFVGKSATLMKNIWHQVRIEDEVQKVDADGVVDFIMYLEGPEGAAFNYDKGFYGGLTVSAEVDDEKLFRIVEFMDQTSSQENYYFCTYGEEGVDWVMQDGFPQLTEKGSKEVTNSFYCPYTLATNDWMKVDSPLATNEENVLNREKATALDKIASTYESPLVMFDVIKSDSWASFWAKTQDEFDAFEVDVVSGVKTVDEFRAYQQELLSDPLVQASFGEFKKSYEEFGLPEQ